MTSQAKPAIRMEKLTKRYRDQVAVDELSLEIPEGSVFGLLGENGAGKTTTLQVLLGLIAADKGRAEVLGLDPSRQGLQIRRRVGYVPEQPALYEWMTVSEIGWFAAGFHPDGKTGTAAFQTRYAALAEGFSLPAKRKIKALSKGNEGQGLALAGPRIGPAAAGARRADLGPRCDGSPRVPREHGRCGQYRADGAPFEPPDR